MRTQERECFAQTLGCAPTRITTHDLLDSYPVPELLARHDAVLLGGSGDYSAAGQDAWLNRILDGLRELNNQQKPTFASCWGFQAFARALGGECVHDSQNAELGAVELALTKAGLDDPVFSTLPPRFLGFAGHEDRVSRLPSGAVLLASSDLVAQQAFRIGGGPIYATQFHPELTRATLLQRLRAYPRYVEHLSGLPMQEFEQQLGETPHANGLLRRFVEVVFG